MLDEREAELREAELREAKARFRTASMDRRAAAFVLVTLECEAAYRKVVEYITYEDGERVFFADYRYTDEMTEYRITFNASWAIRVSGSSWLEDVPPTECFTMFPRLKSGKWAKTGIEKPASSVKYMNLKSKPSKFTPKRKPK